MCGKWFSLKFLASEAFGYDTVFCLLRIHYFSLIEFRFSLVPLWCTAVKRCFEGRSFSCLVGSGKVDQLIAPCLPPCHARCMNKFKDK